MAGPEKKSKFKKFRKKTAQKPSGAAPYVSSEKKKGGANSFKGSPSSARGTFLFKDRSGKVHGNIHGKGHPAGGARTIKPLNTEPRITPLESRPKTAHPQTDRDRNRNKNKDRDFQPARGGKGGRRQDRDRNSLSSRGNNPRRNRAHEGGASGVIRTLKATVDKNRKGFGFLIFENRKIEDAFVPPREADRLFHGDRVEITMDSRGSILSLKLLQHRFRELVGRFSPHPMGPSRGGWVIYERKRAREEVFVPTVTGVMRAGDWVRAKLTFHEKGQHTVTAEIIENYGAELPASADVGMVAAEYNLVEAHSDTANREAKEYKIEVPGRDLEGRVDLRELPLITIDGETARDFDDAVYVERKDGNHVLWVAIADVSHYVKPGTALDHEALSRGTSVYFPERAFHMLPRALSENLCSLKPNEPRLALVARMEFEAGAKRVKTEIMEAVIFSKRRATYTEIQKEWEQNEKNLAWEFHPHFELYQALRQMRLTRGSIDFEFGEAEMKVLPNGELESIKKRDRNHAHKLIEEFMIAANEAVTEWALERDWPFIYRVHDEPTAQALEKFQGIAATVGIHFSIETTASPKVLADIVRRLHGNPAQDLLNMALLRSMKQAIYSSTHGGHFGLASQAYTHFTSPIRRYPDLLVHRMLRRALRVEKKIEPPLKKKELDAIEKTLAEAAEHCSYRERLATDAERESIKLKQVRLMTQHLGDEFDSKIIGMTETGIFVQVEDPFVEGMITKESMTDDYYEYNEERMIFFGRRKRRTFKIGDPIRIRVLRADIDKRQIDFGMIDAQKSVGPAKDKPL